MDSYDEAYDQQVKRALTEYLEESVPDADVWASVHSKLAAKGSLSGRQANRVVEVESPRAGLFGGLRRAFVSYAWGAMGLVVLVLVTTLLLSKGTGLPGGNLLPKKTAVSDTPLPEGITASDEYTVVSTVLIGNPPLGAAISPFGNIAVGSKGEIWFTEGSELTRLLPPSTSDQPAILDNSVSRVAAPYTFGGMVIQGDTVWLMNMDSIYKLSFTGDVLAQYHPPIEIPTGFDTVSSNELRVVDDQVFVELFDGTFLDPVTTAALPAATPLPGYPSGGRFFTRSMPPSIVMAGDVPVNVDLADNIKSLHILKVLSDGSFYIWADTSPTTLAYLTSYTTLYVLHYAADGKLLERARLYSLNSASPTFAQTAVGPNNEVYVIATDKTDIGRVDVVQLKFYPADQPLPPAPTPLPVPDVLTPGPTALVSPTINVPNPIPTDAQRDGEEWLSYLSRALTAVAVVKVTKIETDTTTYTSPVYICTMDVVEWLKKPWQQSIGDGTKLLLTGTEMGDLWRLTGPDFWNDPQAEFVLLLSGTYLLGGAAIPTFSLAENPEHLFKLRDGKVVYAGIEKYKGWDADTFVQTIRHFLEIAATPVPTFTRTPLPTSSPTYDGPALTLEREGEGFRVDANIGAVFISEPIAWLNSSHLLTLRSSEDGVRHASYDLDIAQGTLQPLDQLSVSTLAGVSPDTNHAVFVDQDGTNLRISLLDTHTLTTEAVFDTNPSVPQWTPAGTYTSAAWSDMKVTWLTSDYFVLRISRAPALEPEGLSHLEFGGTLLLADIANHRAQKLTDRGDLGPVLPDGSLVIKDNWIDGPLELLSPPYNEPPQQIAPSGTWSYSWHASPDGSKVAWVEMDAPPGDWSHRLPVGCCGVPADPQPIPRSIAVWNRTASNKSNAISRYPLLVPLAWSEGAESWVEYNQPIWSADSKSLFFAGHPDGQHIGLYRLSLDGSVTKLTEHTTDTGYTGLKIIAASNNGPIYFALTTANCQSCSMLMLWKPDGKTEVLNSGDASTPFASWIVDNSHRLLMIKDGGIHVTDLLSGESHQVAIPETQLTINTLGGWLALSPDERWLACNCSSPDQSSPYGKTIRIVKVK